MGTMRISFLFFQLQRFKGGRFYLIGQKNSNRKLLATSMKSMHYSRMNMLRKMEETIAILTKLSFAGI